MGWNDFNAVNEWQNASFQNMFRQAVLERKQLLGGFIDPLLTTVINTATNIQTAARVALYQSLADANGWVIPGSNLDGAEYLVGPPPRVVSGWPTYTTATARAAAGLNANGYRRVRHRTISSLAATQDAQGNPVANGQKAIFTGNTLFPPVTNRINCIYTRIAGVWVLTNTAHPDLVDTALGTCPAGPMQVGDIFGSWIYTELRATLNLMVWLGKSTGITSVKDQQWVGGVIEYPWPETSAEAKSEAEGNWASIDPTQAGWSGDTKATIAYRGFDPTLGRDYYIAAAERAVYKHTFTLKSTPFDYNFEMYSGNGLFPDSTPTDFRIFDGNGDFDTENTWKLYDTITTNGTPSTTDLYVGSTAFPNWPPGEPDATTFNRTAGYDATATVIGIYKADVPGGFQYHAGT